MKSDLKTKCNLFFDLNFREIKEIAKPPQIAPIETKYVVYGNIHVQQ